MRHGTPAAQLSGCACRRCRVAHRRMVAGLVSTTYGVPVHRSTRRARALMAQGWTPGEVAAAAALDVWEVLAATEGCRVSRHVFSRLYAAYEPLTAVPLPGPDRDRLRAEARARRWWPPFAWDDVDDSSERPSRDARYGTESAPVKLAKHDTLDLAVVHRIMAGEAVPATRREKEEVTRRWLAAGRTWRDLEALTGWRVDAYAGKGVT